MSRTSTIHRVTRETDVGVTLRLDGTGAVRCETGIGFLDHMLASLAVHAQIDIELICRGDLEVDDHHTSEDCALALGAAFDEALGDRAGIERFGDARVPLDEALAAVSVDLVRRPSAVVDLGLTRECLGTWACENITHFFRSLATAGKFCVHVDVRRGENDHHRAEAAFKAFARALRDALKPLETQAPLSTKGSLS